MTSSQNPLEHLRWWFSAGCVLIFVINVWSSTASFKIGSLSLMVSYSTHNTSWLPEDSGSVGFGFILASSSTERGMQWCSSPFILTSSSFTSSSVTLCSNRPNSSCDTCLSAVYTFLSVKKKDIWTPTDSIILQFCVPWLWCLRCWTGNSLHMPPVSSRASGWISFAHKQ